MGAPMRFSVVQNDEENGNHPDLLTGTPRTQWSCFLTQKLSTQKKKKIPQTQAHTL